jgi:glycosyltransferase involved in cell wall biosynthesis
MNFFFKKIICVGLNRISSSQYPKILSILSFLPVYYFKKKDIIISINTHDLSGGASKIAYQIASNNRTEFKYFFFTGIKKRNDDWIYEIPKILDKELNSVLTFQEKKGDWLDFSKLGPIKLRKIKLYKDAKIIHFHNLHGYYFSYALLPVLGKKKRVVWTLHDDHILTGHCSFTMKCERWKTGCGNCPSLDIYPSIKNDNTKAILYWKKKWINQLDPIIVSPSQWLADRVRVSYPLISDIRVINNGIDVEIFIPDDKNKLREELSLPKDKFIVLFVAEFSTNNPFKGGEIVRKVIEGNQIDDICFITIGSENKSKNSNHLEIPYISKEEDLAKLYAASDVLFYPTNADNFPLVVLEAMSCGVPVITSSIAGIPEIIEDNVNGFLVDGYAEVKCYEEKLTMIYKLRDTNKLTEISLNARNTIVEKYNLNKMISEYKSLYDTLKN